MRPVVKLWAKIKMDSGLRRNEKISVWDRMTRYEINHGPIHLWERVVHLSRVCGEGSWFCQKQKIHKANFFSRLQGEWLAGRLKNEAIVENEWEGAYHLRNE